MNHLAHFHLAGECEGRVLGALLADYLRGPLAPELPATVATGVRLHRRIDAYTDGHAMVRGLRTLFGPGERRLAGIVLDLYFDLCLARNWARFGAVSLAAFSDGVHRVLRTQAAWLPDEGRRHAARMEQYALLRRYAEEEVVTGALLRIGQRLALEADMRRAVDTANARIGVIEEDFLVFYPELSQMAGAWIAASAG